MPSRWWMALLPGAAPGRVSVRARHRRSDGGVRRRHGPAEGVGDLPRGLHEEWGALEHALEHEAGGGPADAEGSGDPALAAEQRCRQGVHAVDALAAADGIP